MPSPGTRNAVCRARSTRSSSWNAAPLREDLPVGPVADPRAGDASRHLADDAQLAVERNGVNGASGRSRRRPSNTPGSPRWNDIAQVLPSRSTSTSSRSDSALTTEAPTPCRPPEAAYEPQPNLPPACSLVKTTSTPLRPVFGSMSTGMPRPCRAPRRCRPGAGPPRCPTPWPASASSTELSMISHRQCMSPRESVEPMYMPGRLRTASSPSST